MQSRVDGGNGFCDDTRGRRGGGGITNRIVAMRQVVVRGMRQQVRGGKRHNNLQQCIGHY